MDKTRLSLFYLVSYLTFGGIGLLVAPRFAAALLGSTGDYPEVLLRAIGMFLLGLAMIVAQIIRKRIDALYPTTLLVRAFFCVCLVVFYGMSRDPLFLVLFGIVALGFVITGTSYLRESRRSEGSRSESAG